MTADLHIAQQKLPVLENTPLALQQNLLITLLQQTICFPHQ